MKNKELIPLAIYLLMMFWVGFGFGYTIYKYEDLKNNYDVLEIQYKRDLEDCYTQLGDYQDKVEAGCFMNGGWNCE